jgi:hypothetical protein
VCFIVHFLISHPIFRLWVSLLEEEGSWTQEWLSLVVQLYFPQVMYTDDFQMLGKWKVPTVDMYHDMDTDNGIRGEDPQILYHNTK